MNFHIPSEAPNIPSKQVLKPSRDTTLPVDLEWHSRCYNILLAKKRFRGRYSFYPPRYTSSGLDIILPPRTIFPSSKSVPSLFCTSEHYTRHTPPKTILVVHLRRPYSSYTSEHPDYELSKQLHQKLRLVTSFAYRTVAFLYNHNARKQSWIGYSDGG